VTAPPRPRRAARTAATAAVLAVALASCGLSTDDEPQAITRSTADTGPDTSNTTFTLPGADVDNIRVFFLQTVGDADAVLAGVPRQVVLPATPASRLDALFGQPPTEAERALGLWSAIPADATLADRPVQRGHVLIVDLPESVYDELHGIIAQDAFAQIVWTATAIPGVESVSFRRDGAPFEAVDGMGQARSRPLGRDDFPALAPAADAEEAAGSAAPARPSATTSTTAAGAAGADGDDEAFGRLEADPGDAGDAGAGAGTPAQG
jgi:spore germination protein GerM